MARDGWGYAVFGEVVEGLDVVDKMAAVPTGSKGQFQNVPLTPVVIQKVREEVGASRPRRQRRSRPRPQPQASSKPAPKPTPKP